MPRFVPRRSEEKKCRFCSETLPDWQANLTPPGLSPAEPVMSVHFAGKAYLVRVSPGEDGRKQFLRDIRKMLNLRADQEFDVSRAVLAVLGGAWGRSGPGLMAVVSAHQGLAACALAPRLMYRCHALCRARLAGDV